MDDYAGQAGRLLADRYRLPQPPADSYYLTESVAYDTASGQEVLVRQVPLPEVVEAEFVDTGDPGDSGARGGRFRGSVGRATRRPADPAVRRAVEAAVAAARIPDHPRLDQVFDVFVEGDGLWIVSELLPATPLATLLDDQTLTAHRAAEIAADLLTALRTVHAHGWTHRNVTARTVLICDDGRALLTGLAVGAAQEALCGYNPLPDAGPVPLPPSGAIPGDPARPGGGEAPQPGSEDAPGGSPGSSPATWTGSALPAGFDARQEDEPYGHGGGPDDSAGGQGGDGRPRGIFGLQGLTPDNEPPQTPGSPVRHGYETGGRGPRSGAVAAYQAGARRATARTRADQEHGRDQEHRQDDGASVQGGDRTAGTAGRRPAGDWWTTRSTSPDDRYATPDDSVRWLPSVEDEISPADLPGSRPPNSLPVRASWRTSRARAGPRSRGPRHRGRGGGLRPVRRRGVVRCGVLRGRPGGAALGHPRCGGARRSGGLPRPHHRSGGRTGPPGTDDRHRRGQRAVGARAGGPGVRELAARAARRPLGGPVGAGCAPLPRRAGPRSVSRGRRRRAGADGVRRAARVRRGLRSRCAPSSSR